MVCLSGSVTPVGRLDAVSYVTKKGDQSEVFRHDFDRPGPILFREGTGDVELDPSDVPDEMFAIGRLVDLEMEDGERLVLPGLWVSTDKDGEHVWLTGPKACDYAIERRRGGPIVTAHGIEK